MAIFANGLGGSIGRRLAPRLEGTSLVRLSSSGAPAGLPCDLRSDFSAVTRKFSRGDLLLFLAAMSKPEDCASNPREAWRINVVNTGRLKEVALEAGARVVFFHPTPFTAIRPAHFRNMRHYWQQSPMEK